MSLAQVDSLVTGVSVVLSGMPSASVTAVLAAKYGKDEVFATKCVVLFNSTFHGYGSSLVPVSGIIENETHYSNIKGFSSNDGKPLCYA